MSEPGVGINRRFLYAVYALVGVGIVVFFFFSIVIGLSLILIGVVIYLFNRRPARQTRQGGGQSPPDQSGPT